MRDWEGRVECKVRVVNFRKVGVKVLKMSKALGTVKSKREEVLLSKTRRSDPNQEDNISELCSSWRGRTLKYKWTQQQINRVKDPSMKTNDILI